MPAGSSITEEGRGDDNHGAALHAMHCITDGATVSLDSPHDAGACQAHPGNEGQIDRAVADQSGSVVVLHKSRETPAGLPGRWTRLEGYHRNGCASRPRPARPDGE